MAEDKMRKERKMKREIDNSDRERQAGKAEVQHTKREVTVRAVTEGFESNFLPFNFNTSFQFVFHKIGNMRHHRTTK